jgi:hypothetical protein
VEKLLKLDRPVAERFYALSGEQFNPRSHGTRFGGRRMDFRGNVQAKEKITAQPQQVVDWTFAEKARR